jgi:hypothetical protein
MHKLQNYSIHLFAPQASVNLPHSHDTDLQCGNDSAMKRNLVDLKENLLQNFLSYFGWIILELLCMFRGCSIFPYVINASQVICQVFYAFNTAFNIFAANIFLYFSYVAFLTDYDNPEAHLIILNFITVLIFGKEYKLFSIKSLIKLYLK